MTRDRRRPRVLHVVHALGVGGMERNLEEIVRRTAEQFEHQVCCMRERGALADAFVAAGVPVHDLQLAGNHPLRAARRFAAVLGEVRPDVVHARNWSAIEAVPVARLQGVRGVVFSEHGRRCEPRVRRREWIRRLLSPFVDVFVGPSEDVRDFLVRMVGIRPARTLTIANGVDARRFRPVPDRAGRRAACGLAAQDRIVVALGRLQPVKNGLLLCEAFAPLAAADPRLRLLFVGDGPERGAIEALAAARGVAGQVTITGMRDDVECWLGCADVFAHPSRTEGASNAILQAMACGLPVVASDIAANREMVRHGVEGVLVDSGDRDALAAALAGYANDEELRRRHGTAARRTAVERFPLDRMIAAWSRLYDDLVRGGC